MARGAAEWDGLPRYNWAALTGCQGQRGGWQDQATGTKFSPGKAKRLWDWPSSGSAGILERGRSESDLGVVWVGRGVGWGVDGELGAHPAIQLIPAF